MQVALSKTGSVSPEQCENLSLSVIDYEIVQ